MSNLGFASMFCRGTLGLFVGMVGVHKVFSMGAHRHAQDFFIQGFADHWIPNWLLWPLGYSIPFLELVTACLLLLGIYVRQSAIAIGFLLLVVAYGHLLQDAFYDPGSHFMPRFIFLIGVLLLYGKEDRLALENWLKINKGMVRT